MYLCTMQCHDMLRLQSIKQGSWIFQLEKGKIWVRFCAGNRCPISRLSDKLYAWQHQTITSTNIDLSSKVFYGIHLRAISEDLLMNLIHDMCSMFTLLKLLPMGHLCCQVINRHNIDYVFQGLSCFLFEWILTQASVFTTTLALP